MQAQVYRNINYGLLPGPQVGMVIYLHYFQLCIRLAYGMTVRRRTEVLRRARAQWPKTTSGFAEHCRCHCSRATKSPLTRVTCMEQWNQNSTSQSATIPTCCCIIIMMAGSISNFWNSPGINDIRPLYHVSPCRTSRRRVSPIPRASSVIKV
ncbi:hypothetical protein EDD16DRAFT_122858 [Pisolithus croceorrhizus]|nr:hypothetical protein EDD16DRAFT_122858 [Pisolithus croceorrhizus]